MIEGKKKENFIFKVLHSQKFLVFLGILLMVFLSFPISKNLSKRHEVNDKIKKMEDEIVDFESKNKELKKLVVYLESEEFVEEQARLNLGFKKQGENVLVVNNEVLDSEEKRNSEENEENNQKLLNQQRWVKYFFK